VLKLCPACPTGGAGGQYPPRSGGGQYPAGGGGGGGGGHIKVCPAVRDLPHGIMGVGPI
jgi:hypothetical protein